MMAPVFHTRTSKRSPAVSRSASIQILYQAAWMVACSKLPRGDVTKAPDRA